MEIEKTSTISKSISESESQYVSSNKEYKKCDLCDKTIIRSYFSLHKKSVHEKNKDFACDICGAILSRKDHLKNHKKKIHQNNETTKKPECSLCNRQFKFRRNLERHECKSTLQKSKCNHCEKSFLGQRFLKQHVRRVHKPDEEKYVFKCEIP